MNYRRSWSLALAFAGALSLCATPAVLGQDDPAPQDQSPKNNQASSDSQAGSQKDPAPTGPQAGNQSSASKDQQPANSSEENGQSKNSDANAGQRQNSNKSAADRQSGSQQSQNASKSGNQRQPGAGQQQIANDSAAGNQQLVNQILMLPGNRNNQAGQQPIWSGHAPRNELLRWRASSHVNPLSLAPVDESLRAHLGLPAGEGLVVTSIDPNSSAAEAGIRQNDILTKLGDKSNSQSGRMYSLGSPADFYKRLKEFGETPISLTLLRDGVEQTIQIQAKTEVTIHPVAAKTPPREFWIGVAVTAIEPALRAQLRLPAHGLIISGVTEESPAAKAGVKRHDILLQVDNERLTDPAKLASYVQSAGAKPIVLHLIRHGNERVQLVVTPERRKPNIESSAVPLTNDQTFDYTVVQPGALYYQTNPNVPMLTVPNLGGGTTLLQPMAYPNWETWSVPYTPPVDPRIGAADHSASMTKRLDALDAELKELRNAVMEYKQSAKALDDLKKLLGAAAEAAKRKD
jgi:hypothetical protein